MGQQPAFIRKVFMDLATAGCFCILMVQLKRSLQNPGFKKTKEKMLIMHLEFKSVLTLAIISWIVQKNKLLFCYSKNSPIQQQSP